jgi:hypothetical protein
VDQHRLDEPRLQAHHATQWLARAARSYIPPRPDDDHTSLRWESRRDGFMTRALIDGTRLSLQIPTLTLALHSGDEPTPVQSLPLSGRSDVQARRWLGDQFTARGLDAFALDATSPYEIPAHAIARGASYDPAGSADALAELAAWYANAAVLLGRVRAQMIGRELTALPLRCWPHHFDLATQTNADTIGYIGAWLRPVTNITMNSISTCRCIPNLIRRHFQCCRRWDIGTRTSSRRE